MFWIIYLLFIPITFFGFKYFLKIEGEWTMRALWIVTILSFIPAINIGVTIIAALLYFIVCPLVDKYEKITRDGFWDKKL